MSSRNWPNSSPLPTSPRQVFIPTESPLPAGRVYNNHGLNLYDNHYSAYAPGPAYNPYAITQDPRFRVPFNMSNLGNMNSRALVAAALGPPLAHEELQSHGQILPNLASSLPQLKTRPQPDAGPSSPLTEPAEEELSSNADSRANIAPPDKRKSQTKKRRQSEVSDPDEEYVEDAQAEKAESLVKARKTRSSTRRKTIVRRQVSSEEENIVLPTPPKKVVRKAKLPVKRLIRKKPQGTKVPDTLQEAGDADKMMWFWKNSGRDWEDIRIEWARLTGVKPGKSSLSVRYIKLNENFARNGAAGDLELIKYRKEAEEELLTGLWDRVAEKMLAFNPLSEHNPKDLKKRFDLIVRSGFDIEKLLAEDAAEKKEEGETKGVIAAPAVDKVEAEVDPGLSQLAFTTSVSSTALPPDHNIPTADSDPLSPHTILSRALTEFTDGTADKVDKFDTQELPMSSSGGLSDLVTTEDPRNLEEPSPKEVPGERSSIPPSPAAFTEPGLGSFNNSLVAYGSDSD